MDLDTFFESSSYGQLFIEGAIRSDNLEHVLPKEPYQTFYLHQFTRVLAATVRGMDWS